MPRALFVHSPCSSTPPTLPCPTALHTTTAREISKCRCLHVSHLNTVENQPCSTPDGFQPEFLTQGFCIYKAPQGTPRCAWAENTKTQVLAWLLEPQGMVPTCLVLLLPPRPSLLHLPKSCAVRFSILSPLSFQDTGTNSFS